MSVGPYLRGRMHDVPSCVPPWQLDQPVDGGAVGQVIASGTEELPVGTLVLHWRGWRDHGLLGAKHARPIEPAAGVSSSRYLGVLGRPGLAAYVGLFRIAEFRPGDTVFVSGAAGAVGSPVGRFARLRGAQRVVGSAGSPGEVRYLLDELGFDAALDYHEGPVRRQLRAAAPEGIDVYFDNVGGEHLEAAPCGAISICNATGRQPGPGDLALAIGKRLTSRGSDESHRRWAAVQFRPAWKVAGWSGNERRDEWCPGHPGGQTEVVRGRGGRGVRGRLRVRRPLVSASARCGPTIRVIPEVVFLRSERELCGSGVPSDFSDL
jgi:NADPH:quinone reductase-like Zn-dependent oxidoreductase